MSKNDQVLTWMLLGALAAAGIAYLMANRDPAATGQNDGGVDVEANVGLRSVPFFARGGHYGLYNEGLPFLWEPHRLSYPRTPCPNLQELLGNGAALNYPYFGPGAEQWFAEPPSESMI